MTFEVRQGDALERLREMPSGWVQTCISSPPYYGLRDYQAEGQLGLEATPDAYVAALVAVFREVRRVLRDDGTVWLNLGDSYCPTDKWGGGKSGNSGKYTTNGDEVPSWAVRERSAPIPGVKPKDLLMIPAQVALALRADGWYLRSDIILAKENPMPESVTDRPTSAHEHMFLLSKRPKYWYDSDAIAESSVIGAGALRNITPGNKGAASTRNDGDRFGVVNNGTRNKRNVWRVVSEPYAGAHFAVFGTKWIEPCVLAGSSPKACGECGAPWTRMVEIESRPNWIGNGNQKHDGTIYRENIGGVGNDRRERRDRGWQPSCAHDDDSGRSLILDPFAGSGTVGVVCGWHGRDFVGVELNPTYAEIARRRIVAEGRPSRPKSEPPRVHDEQLSMGAFG